MPQLNFILEAYESSLDLTKTGDLCSWPEFTHLKCLQYKKHSPVHCNKICICVMFGPLCLEMSEENADHDEMTTNTI